MKISDKIWKFLAGHEPKCWSCGEETHDLYNVAVCKECKDEFDEE